MTLYISHINIRSLLANYLDFLDHVSDCDYDIVGVTETWLHNDIESALVQVDNYNFVRVDRTGRRGGGVGIFVKSSLNFEILASMSLDCIEYVWIKLLIKDKIIILWTIYRPPNSELNQFFEHIEDVLTNIYAKYDNIICLGDFNINFLSVTNASKQFESIMDPFGLKQLILEPTRISGHSTTLIDLIFRVPYLKRKKRNPYRITLLSVRLSVCLSVRPSVCLSRPFISGTRGGIKLKLKRYTQVYGLLKL